MGYDPAIHHRRSIRLKGHDYAGGGLYFVTMCAHRDAGNIIAPEEVKRMVAQEWESIVGKMGKHEECPYAIMPDHFHALIRIPVGAGLVSVQSLGDVIGAFKSRVVHEYIVAVKAGKWPRFPGKIWHRNYYEALVRTPEAEQKIREYIRMNPWRCVQNLGGGVRGMGNPALWSACKTSVLCSRSAPRPKQIPGAVVFMGGFHSPMEKEILERLLECKEPVIWCPAWGLERAAYASPIRQALEENRMLMLEMRNQDGDLAAAEQRNRFVLEQADQLWLPHVAPGGMLDRLIRELHVEGKIMG